VTAAFVNDCHTARILIKYFFLLESVQEGSHHQGFVRVHDVRVDSDFHPEIAADFLALAIKAAADFME